MAGIKQQAEGLIRITGIDETAGTFARVQTNIEKSAKATKKQAKATAKLSGLAFEVKDGWSQIAIGVNQAVQLMQTGASLVSGAMDQLRLAAKEGGVDRRFAAITASMGGASRALMALRSAAAYAVDEQSLKKIASTALTAGISLKQTQQLVTVATKMASAGLGDQVEITERLIAAIVERSDGMAKQIGLEADFGQVLALASQELIVSADAFDENAKRQIIFADQLPKLQAEFDKFSTNTVVQQIGQMDAALADLETQARRMARVAMFEDRSEDFEKAIDHAEELRAVIVRLDETTRAQRARTGRAMTMGELFGFTTVEENLEEVRQAQQDLALALKFNGALRERMALQIEEEARGYVRTADGLNTLEKQHEAFGKKQREIIERFGLLEVLLPEAEKRQAAYAKEMGLSSKKATEAEKKAKMLADAIARQTKLNKDAVMNAQRAAKVTAKNMLQQGEFSESIEFSASAVKKYQAAIDSGALSAKELQTAFRGLLQATEAKSESDFRTAIAQAKAAAEMGRGVKAAKLYKAALDQLPSSLEFTEEHLLATRGAANLLNQELLQGLRTRLSIAEIAAKDVDLTADLREAASVRADMLRADIREVEKGVKTIHLMEQTVKKKKPRKQDSEAVKLRKEEALVRRLMGPAQDMLDRLNADLEGAREEMADFASIGNLFTPRGNLLYDQEEREKAFDRAATFAIESRERFNEEIERVQEKFNLLFQDKELKKSSHIQQMLKDGMQIEIDLITSQFNQKEELRQRDTELEQNYHQARIDASKAAGEQIISMRSEMAGYEMNWVSDQYALGAALENALSVSESSISSMVEQSARMSKAGATSSQQFAALAPQIANATGALALGFIDSEIGKASVLAIMETAAGFAALGVNPIGAAHHFTAAALYAGVAGLTAAGVMKGGGGGGGKSKNTQQSKASASVPTPEGVTKEQAAPVQVVVNFTGSTIVGSDEARLQRDMSRILRNANQHGGRIHSDAVGD